MSAVPSGSPDARAELIAAARELAAMGLSPGSSGNASVRIDDRIVATPTGVRLGRVTADDLSVVDLSGTRISGPAPTKELPLHLAFYRRDPQAGAVVHLHSPYAVAASCLAPWSEPSAVPPITPYFVMRVGSTPLVKYAHPGDARQALDVEAMPGRFRAVLLERHGSIVSAADASSAAERAIELEEACRLVVLLSGRAHGMLSRAEATELAHRYGSIWT